MIEIKPTYVTYEQAQLLKKKGFKIPVLGYYTMENKDYTAENEDNFNSNYYGVGMCSRPEQWQVVEWLRVKHKFWITITSISQESWQYHITKPGEILGTLYGEDYTSPQEAYSAAINHILNSNFIVIKIPIKELATHSKYPDELMKQPDDWDGCKIIYRKIITVDSEKNSIEYETVVQRKSDNRFFKFSYTEAVHVHTDILEQEAIEVFPKHQMITTYE